MSLGLERRVRFKETNAGEVEIGKIVMTDEEINLKIITAGSKEVATLGINLGEIIARTSVMTNRVITPKMIGSVTNVKTSISRLGPNVTDVVLRKGLEENPEITGKGMTEEQEIENKNHLQDQATGNAPNVVSQTLQEETIVLDAEGKNESGVRE